MTPTRKNYDQHWLPTIFNDFFDTDWMVRPNATAPAINVIEEPQSYEVEVAAPGMTKSDFHIQLDDSGQLVISMEKQSEQTTGQNTRKYLRREFSYSKFEQTLILPDDVEKDRISAAVSDGVLTITLPKMNPEEKEKACKSIEIQ